MDPVGPVRAKFGLNAQRQASYSIRGVPHAVAPMLSGTNSCHSADYSHAYSPTSLLMISPNNSQRSPLNFLS